MSDDAVKAALERAVEAAWPGCEMVYDDAHDGPHEMIAATIAAFLRALPDGTIWRPRGSLDGRPVPDGELHDLAAAVERAGGSDAG